MNPRIKLAVIALAAALLIGVGPTSGLANDPWATSPDDGPYLTDQYPVGYEDAATVIGPCVRAATARPNWSGDCLLPPDTTVDGAAWVGHVVEVYLTLPAVSNDWRLSEVDAEALSDLLASPFAQDPFFAGINVRVRTSPAEPYGSLAQLLIPHPVPPEVAPPAEMPVPTEVVTPVDAGDRGPTAQAARQPVGALSGVTVFCSAGHGWTAPDSGNWYTQRPVLLEMCEDYGNIDQLNYFVHYAFNAGATVVPFRPVGWQPIEIVLDNDDPGVVYTGSWTNGTGSKYYENGATVSGIPYKWITSDVTETATARYTPTITVSDFYPVYGFVFASTNRTLQTYRIAHSGGISEVTVDHREVGNGWIWLGEYHLEAGGDNYVEITNESPIGGAIIADAIRWGSGWGDIVRPGPGSISGYTRDEEAQRYWAQGELGNNAVGFDDSIWEGGGDDGSDNVGTGARWAREMNQVPTGGVLVDRWKRIHLEFHTNASGGAARGQICLITTTGATTYQTEFATTLSNEVDADLLIADDEFEFGWIDRPDATYTSAYGAISTQNNSDEFDATIVELAFHDNDTDAKLLRDDRVRAAMARACVHGITRFLNSLPGSQVPLAFAPDTPRSITIEDLGGGDVRLAWQAPLSDGARGDPATGYVIYRSDNGYGFGDPIVLGDVLSTTLSGVPVEETRYFRVAATNAGGESMPSEVLAVRRPAVGVADVLVVNGFDRLRRQINPIQDFIQPPAYAGKEIERQIWRASNSYDYIVEHADALADAGYGFSSCANEAVTNSLVSLDDYGAVVWILGTESTEDWTFTSAEQTRVTNYLNNGGGLFVTGSEIAYDLISAGHGTTFAQNTLKIGYSADDANTFQATGAASSILSDIALFDFSPANGAPYEVRSPDVLTAASGASACLNYVGGTGGVAGVQYQHSADLFRTVTFGFPFETITSAAVRGQVMDRVIEFLLAAVGPRPFDADGDGDVDLTDFTRFRLCMKGPDFDYATGHLCRKVDGDEDADVDLNDFAMFQCEFTGPL